MEKDFKLYRLGTPKSGGHVGRRLIEDLVNDDTIRNYVTECLRLGCNNETIAEAVNTHYGTDLTGPHIKYFIDALGGRDLATGSVEIVFRKPQLLVDMSKQVAGGVEERILRLQAEAEERVAGLHALFQYEMKRARGVMEDGEPLPKGMVNNLASLARVTNTTSDSLVRTFYTVEERHGVRAPLEDRFRPPPGMLRPAGGGSSILEMYPQEEEEAANETEGDEEEEISDYPNADGELGDL